MRVPVVFSSENFLMSDSSIGAFGLYLRRQVGRLFKSLKCRYIDGELCRPLQRIPAPAALVYPCTSASPTMHNAGFRPRMTRYFDRSPPWLRPCGRTKQARAQFCSRQNCRFGRCAGMHKCRGFRTKKSDESTQSHLPRTLRPKNRGTLA